MKTTKEILKSIQSLENEERWKLLNKLDDMFNKPEGDITKYINELQHEISNIKQDIEFLSGKIGLHDMYFNRINKEREEAEGDFLDKKMTSKEMMRIVMALDKWESNEERQKFLTEMFYEFYNRSNIPRVEEDWE
jgi:superoxide dismutase